MDAVLPHCTTELCALTGACGGRSLPPPAANTYRQLSGQATGVGSLRQVLMEPMVQGAASSGVKEQWTPSLEHASSQVSLASISEERSVWSPFCSYAVLSFSFA